MAATRIQQASSSFSSNPRWNHDVFLSFRGEDTRKNFTDHLYTALVQKGIRTFRDDDELKRGEDIASELLKAIEESMISIIVFSRNYASSRWCLDELVKVLECKKTKGQMVLPIFYDVDPSDVRKQTGSFVEAFVRHEERFKSYMEKVERWRAALTEAAGLSGWDLQTLSNGHESKFIQKIVEVVLIKLNKKHLNVAIHPVGMESRVKEMNSLLSIGLDDVRIIGIYGMGGIGKTTIAKAVYNVIFHRFEGSSFLANVREVSQQPNGLVHLQEQLLSNILMEKELTITDVDRGINMIKERLRCKRVLIVLDDVDQLNQLNALARMHDWFGLGSRIIITTRDEYLLNAIQVNEKYGAKELNTEESLQLFSLHAFGEEHPIEDYVGLSNEVVGYVGGLPLALEVLGSFLLDKRNIFEWRSALEKLKRIPYKEIQKKLKISFDALDDTEKDIFLDIACFFIGMAKNCASRILDGCGFFSEIGISVLNRRSLITFNEDNTLWMHDLLRDMGREIVRAECPNDPGKRSRLWFHEEVYDVLTKQAGTEAVEGLILNFSGLHKVHLSTQAFVYMQKLRLLQVNYVHLSGCYEHLSKELRWLCWHGFPLKSLPSNFQLENLAVLDMQYSCAKILWNGIKFLRKLKVLDLSYSPYLTKTPDFFGVPSLERLTLKGCISLVMVHQSIGHLDRLVFLNLEDCRNLRNLPSSICQLKSLENLVLSGCSKLNKLPEELGNMECLTELLADGTAIKQLPFSIWFLKNLRSLSLRGCKGSPSKSWLSFFWPWGSPRKNPDSISLLPNSFSGLCSLNKLVLSNCNLSEGAIPKDLWSLSSLQVLDISENNFCSISASINRLSQLQTLWLHHCTKLQSLPELPSSLTSLYAYDCTSLERLSNVSNFQKLPHLFLTNCDKLLEIQGVERLESLGIIHVEECKSLATTFWNGLLQGPSEFSFFLPGSDVPEWFTHQSIGSSISFEVPPLWDHKIQGLTVCAVYAADKKEKEITSAPHASFTNKTKGLNWNHWPTFFAIPITSQDHMWVGHIPKTTLENELAAGDEVVVSMIISTPLQVKKCGIHLLYESDEKGSQPNDQAMILYADSSYVDEDGSVFNAEAKTKRSRKDDGEGPSDYQLSEYADSSYVDEDGSVFNAEAKTKRSRKDDGEGPSDYQLSEDRDPKRLRTGPGLDTNLKEDKACH